MRHRYLLILMSLFIVLSMLYTITDSVQALPSGTWTPTGTMTVQRLLHTATLLPDGRVLVAGGVISAGGRITAAAELYDPALGTWTATADMTTPRSQHMATLLSDGNVLVTGGSFRGASLSTAEIFHPATGTWTSTGSMSFARNNHVATLLLDGRVLVTGGVGSNSGLPVENSAEVYDPQTGRWSTIDHMANARYNHQSTLLPDGRVLVTGGFNVSAFHVPLKTTEIYDPATGTWKNAAAMSTSRATHLSFLLQNGGVLVAGGWTQPGNVLTPTATVEVYDPGMDSWTSVSPMSAARGAISNGSVMLWDGRVLVTGGRNANDVLASVDLYNPISGAWSLTASMEYARSGSHTATLLPDGRVLVAGGRGTSGTPLSSAEVYTP